MSKSPPTVFISYAREDLGDVRKLHDDLKRAGAKPWLDVESLLPGQRWRVEIKRAIRESRYFLAVLSSNSVSREGYVHKELADALEILDEFPDSEIFIIPVRLDDCSPSHEKLRDLQWVDMFPSWDDGFKKILRAIKVEIQPEGNGIRWDRIGIIAAVIGGVALCACIALSAWLGPNAVDLFSTRPSETTIAAVTSKSPTDTPTVTPTATPIPPTNTSTPELPTSTLTSTPAPINATVTAEGLNLRTGPGVGYAIIGRLQQGDVATVIGQNPGGDWLKVEHKGQTGWVARRYVEAPAEVVMVPTAEVSPIKTPTSTPELTETPTPSALIPTSTPTATPIPPTNIPVVPTDIPTPPDTPVPPTATPTSTDTPEPTPTNTLSPTPTATNTPTPTNTLTPTYTPTPSGEGVYYSIIVKHSGKCLDVEYSSPDDGADVVQFECKSGQPNQKWQLVKVENGYYNIIAKHSGKCLNVEYSSLDDGADVVQFDCQGGGDNQKWKLVEVENGYYNIIAKHTGKCLDVAYSSPDDGADVVQFECKSGQPNQKWQFVLED